MLQLCPDHQLATRSPLLHPNSQGLPDVHGDDDSQATLAFTVFAHNYSNQQLDDP